VAASETKRCHFKVRCGSARYGLSEATSQVLDQYRQMYDCIAMAQLQAALSCASSLFLPEPATTFQVASLSREEVFYDHTRGRLST
jgi:hypothetical protein